MDISPCSSNRSEKYTVHVKLNINSLKGFSNCIPQIQDTGIMSWFLPSTHWILCKHSANCCCTRKTHWHGMHQIQHNCKRCVSAGTGTGCGRRRFSIQSQYQCSCATNIYYKQLPNQMFFYKFSFCTLSTILLNFLTSCFSWNEPCNGNFKEVWIFIRFFQSCLTHSVLNIKYYHLSTMMCHWSVC